MEMPMAQSMPVENHALNLCMDGRRGSPFIKNIGNPQGPNYKEGDECVLPSKIHKISWAYFYIKLRIAFVYKWSRESPVTKIVLPNIMRFTKTKKK